jgi:hypothetical protein
MPGKCKGRGIKKYGFASDAGDGRNWRKKYLYILQWRLICAIITPEKTP